LAQEVDADVVVIDSLKDAAVGLEKSDVGQLVNRAHQLLVSNGIELIINHHPRKSQIGNKKPQAVDDLFGSRFIGDGCGSIVLLWGEPGDALVEFMHLKQPREAIGPWKLEHDHPEGRTTLAARLDVYDIIRRSNGITNTDVAKQFYETVTPSASQKENARLKVKALIRRGLVVEVAGDGQGILRRPTAYYASTRQGQNEGQNLDSEDVALAAPSKAKNGSHPDTSEGQKQGQLRPNGPQATEDQKSGSLYREAAFGLGPCWKCGAEAVTYDINGEQVVCDEHRPVSVETKTLR
jgi:hypothetical protein